MEPIVIFGAGKVAEVLHCYLKASRQYQVVACCIEAQFITHEMWRGSPVVALEHLPCEFPPHLYRVLIAVGYHDGLGLRARIYDQLKSLGYQCVTYQDPKATILSEAIGEGSIILDNTTIQPTAKIAENVVVWSQAFVGHHSVVGQHSWVNPGVVICGDTHVGEQCYLSVGSVVGQNVALQARCFLGARALVTKSADSETVFIEPNTEISRLKSPQFWQLSQMRVS